MNVLPILLWKHRKERLRRIGHTTWEIVSGVLVFLILLLVKQALFDDAQNIIEMSHDVDLVDIAFAPKNEWSKVLMSHICSQQFEATPDLHDVVNNCYGLDNGDQLNHFLWENKLAKSETIVGILFKDLNDSYIPDNLRYSIRSVGHQSHKVTKLEDLYYLFENTIPRLKDTTFLASLQWEIDKSYMETVQGEPIDHRIAFKTIAEHTSPALRVIQSFLILCTVLAPLPFFMTTQAALVDEKRSGIQALLKLSGVHPNEVRIAHLIDTAIFSTIYAVLIVTLLKVTSTPILEYSNPLIIGFTFILHFMTVTSLAFITSTLSQNNQHADSLALLFYLMTFLINMLWAGRRFGSSFGLTLIYVILPHSPVFMFWNTVIVFENQGEGAVLRNIYKYTIPGDTCVLVIWFLFLVQLGLVLIISWYLELVRPGCYGVALPWHFIFSKKFWLHIFKKHEKRRGVNFHVTAEKKKKILRDTRYFQPAEKGTKIAIKIASVSKEIPGHRGTPITILDRICLDVYKGKITVVLGTNGSGKSSLMSIVTGMFSATGGHVYINGMDIQTRLHDLMSDLAHCPQRDLTFDYLTVKENLTFFEYLKHIHNESDTVDAAHMMKAFKMTHLADYYSKQLTAGYRRCLQVACALLGNADVLVLDEPTSGMDAGMRHRLWDLLLTLRHQKTILMTTSHMQEADALGDMIALIHHGKLKCHGSPAFLKNAIGVDVILSIRLSEKVPEKNIDNVIHSTIKSAEMPDSENLAVLRTEKRRVSVNLPGQHRDYFPKVFDILENRRHELGIMSMDVGVSMEQVFLRFVEDDDDIDPFLKIDEYASEVPLQGWELSMLQIKCLVKRSLKYVWCHKYQFIIVQIVVPFVALVIVTIASNIRYSRPARFRMRNLGPDTILYNPVGGYRRANDLFQVKNRYPAVKFVFSDDISKDVANLNKKYEEESNQITGIESDEKRTEIVYLPTSAPVLNTAVNIFSNMYMSLNVPRASRKSINMTYEPLTQFTEKFRQPKNLYLCFCWSMWVTFLVILPIGPLIRLCIEEFYNGVRYNHLLMGCPPYLIWLSKLIAHLAIYLSIVPWSVLFVAWFLDNDSTIDRFNFLGAVLLLLIFFGPAYIIHWYVLSFTLSTERPIAKMYIVSLCFGLIAPIFIYFLTQVGLHWPAFEVFLYVLYVLANFIPALTFSVGMGRISTVARNNAFCRLNHHLCPNDMVDDIWVPAEVCCGSDGEPFSYYRNFETGLFELLFLILQSVFYWTLLMMLQRRTLQSVWLRILNSVYPYKEPLRNPNRPFRVRTEEVFVRNKIHEFKNKSLEERQEDEIILIADNLRKTYGVRPKKLVHAVRGISFAIKGGEALAILGRNGAGKSTTLGMIAGYTVRTGGVSCVNGFFWKENRDMYLRNVSWCTERGLDEFLTGLQNITQLAALFGYAGRDASRVAERYLEYMGLSRHSHTPFGSYSPGCSHRLAVCAALVRAPRAALLDELCACVDPHTLPLVSRAVQRLRDKHTACLIAEESLEWKQIDEFCSRLAIIDEGELVAIGTVGDIRRVLASGFTATLKLTVDKSYHLAEEKTSATSIISGKSLIENETTHLLKQEFTELFETSLLVDEHISMLYYHIKDPCQTMTYSQLFLKLEYLMKKYEFIEDYTLSETSIDELLCRIAHQLHGDSEQKRDSLKIFTLE